MVRRPPVPGHPSLFGAAATDPGPDDLAGLLAGPGTLRRMGGTVQVAVVVEAAWRVHALVAELARRGLPGGWEPAGEHAFTVRTAFTTRLLPLARQWAAGPPPALHLGGQALRLWVAAAGTGSPDGYLLGLDPDGEADWAAVGAALAAAGLAGALVAPARGTRPAYRISGRRRLARLAELVGEPPPAAPPGAWPAA